VREKNKKSTVRSRHAFFIFAGAVSRAAPQLTERLDEVNVFLKETSVRSSSYNVHALQV